MSTDERSDITAISSMTKITESVITGVLQKMDRISSLQETMYREQDAMNQNIQMLRREVKEVIAELKRISDLIPSDTTLALTAPLLDIQDKSRRRKEISNLHRQQNNSPMR